MARTLIVSDRHNSFFSANNIRVGNQIPTEGNYVKGDIIVNIGDNTASEAMWICVESGNPGIWEVVGAGAGGNGGSNFVSINNTVFVNEPVNEVELGLGVAITSKDKLIVHHNSVHLMQGVDYRIEGNKIVKLTEGNWNEDSEEAMFAFELFKNVESVDGDKIVVDSKMTSITNHVVIENACSEVEIGIEGFNAGNDMMLVFKNGVNMVEGVDYEVQGGKIVSTGEVWNENGIEDYGMTFVVFKEVVEYNGDAEVKAENIADGSIGLDKLGEDVREAIEDASNIDLSGKQDKTDESLLTESKDVIGAINELFQSANNGKELIADAIGEPLNAEDTFSAMSDDINGLLSTFKTNMMNNGVTVESSDRFKTLIDKIATIADNEGKGVQYAEVNLGTISVKEYGYGQVTKTYNYSELDVNFIPTIFFIHFPNYFILSNLQPNDSSINQTGQIKSFNDNGFTIYIFNSSSYAIDITDITLYAIGVGEEDTTLRDSLASILQEEGVSVTEEDDMASLISKVDSEFDRQVVPAGDAVAANVLSGKTFINSTGQVVTGSMTEHGYYTDYTGYFTTNDVNIFVGIQPGAYLSPTGSGYPEILIPKSRVNNLSPENIVSGKEILGVWGTATASSLGGKRITSGTGTVTANGNSHRQLIVTGLPFRPRIVFVQSQSAAIRYVSNIDFGAIYVRGDTGGAGYFSCDNTDTTDPSTLASNIRKGNNYMGPNWFGMYVVDSVGASVSWIAWE